MFPLLLLLLQVNDIRHLQTCWFNVLDAMNGVSGLAVYQSSPQRESDQSVLKVA